MATLSIDYILDIETEEWDKFTLGGLLNVATGEYDDYDHTREEELVERICELDGLRDSVQLWTWNGGLFDTLWLAQHLRKRGVRCRAVLAGTRVLSLSFGRVSVRDGAALYPTSLQKAARAAGHQVSKDTGLVCDCGKKCGGYCRIKRNGMSDPEWASLRRYLRLDCVATAAALQGLIAEAERCGYELAATVGSCSYKTAKRICDIPDAEWPHWPIYKFAREADYGGRVEVFRPMSDRGYCYDINMAYPAACSQIDLPVGDCRLVRGERAERAYVRERPGVYMARVFVPPTMFVPPLPVRTPGGRIIFPVGWIRGVWTILELSYAESLGCRVSIDRALVWSDAECVLKPYMEHVFNCRQRCRDEGNEEMAGWHKYQGNAPTGKFSERPEKERLVINPTAEEILSCTCGGKSKRACRCKGWRPLDQEGEIWAAPFWRIPSNGHVHWGAYLRSSTRITLHKQLVDDGEGGRSAIYCDTDCVDAVAERTWNIGMGLGQWKCEGTLEPGFDPDIGEIVPGWLAVAPKNYRQRKRESRRSPDHSGPLREQIVVRGKGLSGLTPQSWDAFRRGEGVMVDRGVQGFRSAARSGGLFARKRLERRNHADGIHFGGRILGRDGLTYPQTLAQVTKWERGR